MISTPYAFRIVAIVGAACTMLAACTKKGPESSQGDKKAIDTVQLAPGAPNAAAPADSTRTADTSTTPVATHTAVISTSMGDIEVELYGNDAPKTVKNFVDLAKKKYYDGVAFHRVIPGFMIQTGDPNSRNMSDRSGWGQGGESIYGKTFEDELNPATPSYRRGYKDGVLAMANAGPNTNGSQFFIVLTEAGAGHLPHSYTIFGFVRNGMDVVRKIGETGAMGEQPEKPATIKTITARPVGAAVTAETKTGDAKTGATKGGEVKAGEAKAGDAKAGETKAAETKSGR